MLFYNFNTLNNLINNNLITNLKIEKENITKILNLYNKKKATFNSSPTTNQINSLINLASKLSDDLTLTISLYNKDLINNENEIKANLVEYNKQRDELFNNILAFENNIIDTDINDENIVKNVKNRIDIDLEPHDHNVLIISEEEQKAYLPFFYNDVLDIFKNSDNKYKTLQDVIEDLYIIPLKKFKNSSISRFREAFNLAHKKQNYSIIKSFDLALELMFKYDLNPIIISACRTIDELDIYLDCLEKRETFEFECFEIKFQIFPHT